MEAYGYNQDFIFTGMVTMQLNPRGGGYLLPANATEIPTPSDIPVNYLAKFDFNLKEWALVLDPAYVEMKLNEVDEYNIKTHELNELGEPVLRVGLDYAEEIEKFISDQKFIMSLSRGGAISALSKNILNLVIDHNYSNAFTAEEITQMQATFGTIEGLLRADRPFHAKPLIVAAPVDGVIVTNKLKANIARLYTEFANANL
jgi:hypothetical protein